MRSRKIGSQFVVSIIFSLLAVALNYIISLILTPYITENLGTEAYGFVSLAKTFSNYASIFTVALNSFSSRYITIEYHRGNLKQANKYFSSIFIADIVLGGVIFIISIVVIVYLQLFLSIPSNLIKDVKILFLMDMVNFLILSNSTVFMAATIVKNRLEIGSIIRCIAYLLEAIFLYAIFSLLEPKVYYVGFGLVLCSCIIFILNIYITKKYVPELRLKVKDFSKTAVNHVVGAGIWNSINNLGNTLNTGLDLLISNVMLSPLVTGQLAIVKTISTICTTMFQLIAQPFQPLQLKYYANGDKKQLISSFMLAIKINGMFSNIIFAGFTVFGSVYYKLWTPSQNIDLLQMVSIITIMGSIIEGAVYPLYYVYTLTVKNRIPCFITIGSGILNILGMYILIKYCNAGIYGVVATTTVLTWLVNFIFNPIYSARCLSLPKYTFYPTLLKHILSCIALTCVFYGVSQIIYPTTWIGLIAIALICAAIGVILHLSITLDKIEKRKLFAKIKSKVA